MSFRWTSNYKDLQLVCKTFGLYKLDDPDKYCYKIIPSVTQQGPQCGIVALVMCTENPSKDKVHEIVEHAQKEGFTKLGELFSVDYMCQLALRYLPNNKVETYGGSLSDPQVIQFLFNRGTVLVPYDCDKNHAPIKKGGRSAHWAIVFGIVQSYAGVFVIAKQGKSLNVHVWDIQDLAESNQQLMDYENEKTEFGYKYVIPEGGMGGIQGLCKRCLFIYPNENTKCFKS